MQNIIVAGRFRKKYIRDETLLYLLNNNDDFKIIDKRYLEPSDIKKGKHGNILAKLKYFFRNVFNELQYYSYILFLTVFLLFYKNNYNYIFVFRWNEPLIITLSIFDSLKSKIIYDLFVSRYLYAKTQNKNIPKWERVEQKVTDCCQHYLAETPLYRSFYSQKYDTEENKIKIVPLLPDRKWVEKPISEPKSEKPLIVGYWGNVLPQHGVKKIFKVAKMLKNNDSIKFRFYGKEKINYHKYSKFPNIEVKDFIPSFDKFIDSVDEIDIAFGHLNPIHDAHLVLPSKAMESMARGKVTIHTYDSKLKDYIDSFGYSPSMIFYKDTVEDLKNQILKINNNPDLKKEIGNNARKLILEKFNVTKKNNEFFNFLTN